MPDVLSRVFQYNKKITISDLSLRKGRRVMSLVAKEYGYKGHEIVEHLWRNPSVSTRYLKEGDRFRKEIESVHAI